jgi:thiol-disulfide isomerase/thioredoxin
MDYYPLHYSNHALSEPAPDVAACDEPIPVIDVAYNDYVENGKGRTVAVTFSIRLPNASWCPYCEAAAPVPSRSSNHQRQEA